MKLHKLTSLNRKLNGQRLGNYLGIGMVALMLLVLFFRRRPHFCFRFFNNEPVAAEPRINVFKI